MHNANTILIDDQPTIESNSVAAVELSQLAAKNVWSCYPKKPVSQVEWEESVKSALDAIAQDNPYQMVEPYQEVSAIDAVNFKAGSFGLDVRPKVFDSVSQIHCHSV